MTTITSAHFPARMPGQSRWTLNPIKNRFAKSQPAQEPAFLGEADDTTTVQPQPIEFPEHGIWNAFKLALMIIGVMALGAAIVAVAVLDSSLMVLGFCVALLMMAFIGMPLVLASIADARDA